MSGKRFIVIVFCLFCLANLTRWAFRNHLGYPRFMAEGAAHYRYTEMVAGGGAVPALDRKAQWPEGLRVYRETSIAMEYLCGFVYRLIPGGKPDLPSFIRFFSAFFFSLAVFPISFLSADLWRSRAAGILSAAIFAVSLPVVGRSSGFEFIRENVTFPLLVYHVYFFFSACRGAGGRGAVLSGVFLFLALGSWQGSQFYLVPLLLFLLVRRIAAEVGEGERRAVRYLIVFMLAAGGVVPFLREGRFLLSAPAALGAAWIAADLIPTQGAFSGGRPGGSSGGRRFARLSIAAAALACVLLPGILSGRHSAEYSHFFKLVLYKLRYLEKPSDPRILPFDVRAFWVGPFHSPDARHFFVFALPVLVLLPAPAVALERKARGGDPLAAFALVFLVLFFGFFLLMQRLLPLFGIMAAVVGGGNAPASTRNAGSRFAVGPSLVLTACVLAVSALQVFFWEGPGDVWRRAARMLRVPHRERFVVFPYARDVDGALISWIKANTGIEDVIMSQHYLSPLVLAYTGRATNLNDFFESPALRAKAEKLLSLLYSSEERLYEFCREQSSDYILVSAAVGCDPTKDSPLYQAGLLDIPPDCAAYRLLFEPERLGSFSLVYENENYRLFKVGAWSSKRHWPRSPLFYEKDLLWHHEGDVKAFYRSVMRIYALTSTADEFAERGNKAEAERFLSEALRIFYFYPAWRRLYRLYSRLGRLEEREALAEFAYRYDPDRSEVCIELARSRLELGSSDGVRDLLDRCSGLYTSKLQKEQLRRLAERLAGMSR